MSGENNFDYLYQLEFEELAINTIKLNSIKESLNDKILFWSNTETWNSYAAKKTQELILGELFSLMNYIEKVEKH